MPVFWILVWKYNSRHLYLVLCSYPVWAGWALPHFVADTVRVGSGEVFKNCSSQEAFLEFRWHQAEHEMVRGLLPGATKTHLRLANILGGTEERDCGILQREGQVKGQWSFVEPQEMLRMDGLRSFLLWDGIPFGQNSILLLVSPHVELRTTSLSLFPEAHSFWPDQGTRRMFHS